jgi:hypothetical protein
MPERRRFLRGMVAWVGFEQVPIEYRRAGRHSGRGASYRSLFRLAARGAGLVLGRAAGAGRRTSAWRRGVAEGSPAR